MSFILSLLFACGEEKTDSAEPLPKPVLVDITLLDAIQGDAMGNATLTSTLDEQTTDATGKATVLVQEEQAITVIATASGYIPHHLELFSGRTNYSAVSLMASREAGIQIYSLLNPSLEVQVDKGIVIVALDNPDLSPAVGARASISGNSDDPFILTNISATYSNEVTASAAGFVAFPNVEAGAHTITVTSPEGKTCQQHVAGAVETAEIEVLADTVHVVFFMCAE